MKNKVRNIVTKPAFKLLIFSIMWIMVIVPLLSTFDFLSKTARISWIFLIINIIITVLIGRYVKLNQLNHYIILIFPAVFVIQVIIRYGNYGFLFGAIYLLISLLSYILTIKK